MPDYLIELIYKLIQNDNFDSASIVLDQHLKLTKVAKAGLFVLFYELSIDELNKLFNTGNS